MFEVILSNGFNDIPERELRSIVEVQDAFHRA